jgi:phosphotransferase system HPr (HPr) family protein
MRLTATVRNEHGIHCRPSAVIIKEAAALRSSLQAVSASGTSDLRSIVDLLAMGLGPGDTVDITAEGPDEALAAARLQELFERRFDFPPREKGQSDDQVLRQLGT